MAVMGVQQEADDYSPWTVSEVAERLGVTPLTVRRYIRDGRLPAFRLPGGAWRIEPEAVEHIVSPKQANSAARE